MKQKISLLFLASVAALAIPSVSCADVLGNIQSGFFAGAAVDSVVPDASDTSIVVLDGGLNTRNPSLVRPEVARGYGQVFGSNPYVDGYIALPF